jgi:hypothetical protein
MSDLYLSKLRFWRIVTHAVKLSRGLIPIFIAPAVRETLIKCLATANAADLPDNFGKNAQDTTSIPVLFACTMHQSHRRSQ